MTIEEEFNTSPSDSQEGGERSIFNPLCYQTSSAPRLPLPIKTQMMFGAGARSVSGVEQFE